MNVVVLYIVGAGLVVLLALGSGLLAKRCRRYPWLAGSSASTTLFLAGLIAISSWFTPGAFLLLAAVWLSMAAIAVAHLLAARKVAGAGSIPQPVTGAEHVEPEAAEREPAGEFVF